MPNELTSGDFIDSQSHILLSPFLSLSLFLSTTHTHTHTHTHTSEGAAVMISSRKAENVEKTVKELQAEKLNVFGVPCHVGECLIPDTSVLLLGKHLISHPCN